MPPPITFIVCCNNRHVLQANLLASPCLQGEHDHQVVVMEGVASAAAGFHQGLEQARHELVVLLHQDVFLPAGWDRLFWAEIARVRQKWNHVGLIGVYGRHNRDGLPVGQGRVVDRGTLLQGDAPLPCLVDTLDEVVLAFPRHTPLRLDEHLGFHLYGSDAVLTARDHGLAAAVVDAPVHHNSALRLATAPASWWTQVAASCRYFESKWQAVLPYHSTCFSFSPHCSLGDHLAQGVVTRQGQTVFSNNHAMWLGLIRAYPRRLNLGSGSKPLADYLNVDLNPACKPDMVWDIGKPMTLPALVRSRRFGEFILRPAMFREIVANHVLEHIPDLVTAMTNCLTLLEENGLLKVMVPYDLSCGAWQDPTHVRAFNEQSWLYFTDLHGDLGWQEARFDLVEIKVVLSPMGQSLKDNGLPTEDIMRTPRAVNEVGAVLRKRSLTLPATPLPAS